MVLNKSIALDKHDTDSHPTQSFIGEACSHFSSFKWQYFSVVGLLTTIAKVLVSKYGAHNFDGHNFFVLASNLVSGGSLYFNGIEYPYPPMWVPVLEAIQLVSGNIELHFAAILAGVLGAFDFLTGYFIACEYGLAAGFIFLLNPLSFLISGGHRQMDNVAISIALSSFILFRRYQRELRVSTLYSSLFCLGVSLSVKHTLFFLPFFYFFSIPFRRFQQKFLTLAIPYGTFLATLAPWLIHSDKRSVVWHHLSNLNIGANNGIFPKIVEFFFPPALVHSLFDWFPVFSGYRFPWFGSMILLAWWTAKHKPEYILPISLAGMVAFSTSIFDQYLVIPAVCVAIFWKNPFMWCYLIEATLILGRSEHNIGQHLELMTPLRELSLRFGFQYYHAQMWLIVFLLWMVWKEREKENMYQLNGAISE